MLPVVNKSFCNSDFSLTDRRSFQQTVDLIQASVETRIPVGWSETRRVGRTRVCAGFQGRGLMRLPLGYESPADVNQYQRHEKSIIVIRMMATSGPASPRMVIPGISRPTMKNTMKFSTNVNAANRY